MPKNRHSHAHRKPHNLSRKRGAQTSRRAISFLILFGAIIIGATFFLNFIAPNETQSSIDRSYVDDAARHEPRDEEGVATQSENDNLEEAEAEGAEKDDQELPMVDSPRDPELTRMTGTVRSGDTPTTLLGGHLAQAEINALCAESADVYALSKLKAGQPWTMVYADNSLVGLEYEIDSNERLVVSMTDDGYEFRREPIPYDVDVKTVEGVIQSSLFGAVLDLGESEELAIRLADVFAYDVDFVRDLQVGDSFKAIIEKRFRDGKFAGYGKLRAASFTNQGQTFYAFRFTDRKGIAAYYDQTGRPLRKAFLKSPLPFTRISSGYSMKRMHPILNYVRPHQGIDYSAPTGTPISTVADGVIAEAGRNGSQGLFVRVVHSNGYETIYNHMSKFGKNSKKGARVNQGATIGYVGSTGYSTGPHLDFRMKQNGTLINPLKLKVLPADPIPAKEMSNFKAAITEYKTQLLETAQASAPDQAPAVQ